MMKSKCYFLLLFIVLSVFSNAQDDDNEMKGFNHVIKFSAQKVTNSFLESFDTQNGSVTTTLPTNDGVAFELGYTLGYFITPKLTLGLGLSFEGHQNPNANSAPVVINSTYYFKEYSNSGFMYLEAGKALALGGEFRKGRIFNAGIGYRLPINQNETTFLISDIGVAFHDFSLDGQQPNKSDSLLTTQGIRLSIGLMF